MDFCHKVSQFDYNLFLFFVSNESKISLFHQILSKLLHNLIPKIKWKIF